MSYLNRKTLEDFEEAWKCGVKLTEDEIKRFDKIVDTLEKESYDPEHDIIVSHLKEIREDLI